MVSKFVMIDFFVAAEDFVKKVYVALDDLNASFFYESIAVDFKAGIAHCFGAFKVFFFEFAA